MKGRFEPAPGPPLSRDLDREAMVEAVSEDIVALVESLAGAITGVTVLTSLPSPSRSRAVFRLTLADGRVFKARRFDSPDQAEQVAKRLSAVSGRAFRRIRARAGAVVLEDWISGTRFDLARRPLADFARAGRVLASLHATPVEHPRQWDGRRLAQDWHATLIERIERLRTIGMLTRRCRDRLLDSIATFVPRECRISLVHGDFCAENIVIDRDGEVCSVDSETLDVNAAEFDLARVWYRWPMRKLERAAFGEGYSEVGRLDDFLAHFPFWATAALASAALYRIVQSAEGASRPIRMLHKISGPAWSGARARQHVAAYRQGTCRSFHFAGIVVGARSEEAGHLAWLEEFLSPQFRVGSCATPHVEVDAEADAKAFSKMRAMRRLPTDRQLDAFLMDDRMTQLPVWAEDEEQRVAWDGELRAFYIVDRLRPRVRVLCKPGENSLRLASMRAIRELGLRHSYRRGEPLVHAAALAVGDKGIAIAGQKGAGKSTLLIHLLQGASTRYISNDRLILRSQGGRYESILGVPTVISLHRRTMEFFPRLGERQGARGFRHRHTIAETAGNPLPAHLSERSTTEPSITPRQFCELVGSEPAAGATLSAILFPRRTGRNRDGSPNRGIVLHPLAPEEAARRLRAALFGPHYAIPGGSFLGDIMPCAPQRRSSIERLVQLTSGVRCFDCLLGPEAYARKPAAELLREIA